MPSGAKARVVANLTALRLLRSLGDHPATPAQQQTLAGWSSWGAVPDVFNTAHTGYAAERGELRELLTDREWNAAARTTLNAHYTDPRLVAGIWQLLTDLGLPAGARVLEPGCGSGNFIGHAPPCTLMTGVELDPVTAQIAAKLYPSAAVRTESFADTRHLPGFDAAVGNVPFGDVVLHDSAYNRGRHSIHNHFIVKALGMTNPGGLVAVLTSRYTLDAQNPSAREDMAHLAQLVTAIRLPAGTHWRVAGTNVVTDLLVFARHTAAPDPGDRPDWVDTVTATISGVDVTLNRYLDARPDHVLGQLSVEHGQYADALTVTPPADLPAAFTHALHAAVLGADADQDRWRHPPNVAVAHVGGRPSSFAGHIRPDPNGVAHSFEQGDAAFTLPAGQADELHALLGLRDVYVALLDAEAAAAADTVATAELRGDLNDAYHAYTSHYGPLNRYTETTTTRRGEPVTRRRYPPAVTRFRSDPHAVYVRALEVFDETTQTASEASILHSRVLTARQPRRHADTPAEAIALSLDAHGDLQPATIADLLAIPAEQVRAALGDLVYDEPGTGRLIPAAEYLSGDVRDKLDAARLAAAEQPDPYQANVAALRAAVPNDLQPGEIRAALGATWIDPGDVRDFLHDTLRDRAVNVTKDAAAGWKVTGGNRNTIQATEEWGTSAAPAHKLVQNLLNQTPTRVYDEDVDGTRVENVAESTAARDKARQLGERFAAWTWEDPERSTRLADRYNRLFNNLVLRHDYLHGPMELPGLALSFTPGRHQLNAVARAIHEPCTGVFHPVGYGKTATMVMSLMEQKRLGLITKPALVVPNHMLEQAQREFLQLYPAARILAATSEDLTRDRRRTFVAQVTNGDWDTVIMTRTAFAALPVSAEELRRYLEVEIAPLREAFEAQRAAHHEESRSVKQAEKALLQLEERIKAKLDSRRDLGVTFEQTGIDYVCVDEIHDYKNLATPSRIPGAGIGGSQRATDLHQKVSYLRRVHGDRAILGATATPLSNSVSEVFVMLRYLRPDLLTAAGIGSFDEWAATFGQTITSIELAPAGDTFRETTRFARFCNVPELLTMWSAAGDVLDPGAVDLPRPQLAARADTGERTPQPVQVPASPQLAALTANLAERARTIHSAHPKDDNMLKITSEGRLAGLDLRLTPRYRHEPPRLAVATKAETAAARIHQIWADHIDRVYRDTRTGEAHPRPGALQLVFCDLGTPKSDGTFSVYAELRDQLTARGVPADQIAFTHTARNDVEKGRLFERARTGEIQVLIGSTQMMGVGTNVQARAIALHHLDCPWKPAEIEQREGRIVRQGNQNPEVTIFRYATEKSFDAYMYQTVARKAAFIDQVMHGNVGVREIDDISSSETLSYEEMQAAISGNPYLRDKQQVDSEIAQLDMLARTHRNNAHSLTWRIGDCQRQIDNLTGHTLPSLTADVAHFADTRGDRFTITIGGQHYTDRRDAAHALAARLDELSRGYPDGPHTIGRLGGLDLTGHMTRPDYTRQADIVVTVAEHGKITTYTAADRADPTPGLVIRLENAAADLPTVLTGHQARLADLTDQLARAHARQGQPFPQQDHLDRLRSRQAELGQAIAALARGGDVPDQADPLTDSAAPRIPNAQRLRDHLNRDQHDTATSTTLPAQADRPRRTR